MKLLALFLLVAVGVAALAETPRPPKTAVPLNGKALFQEKCAMCHGAGGMGTGLLGRRVQPALLEQRTDLEAEYVITASRTGIGNMPAIPRGEVSDAELRAIADFLSRRAPAK